MKLRAGISAAPDLSKDALAIHRPSGEKVTCIRTAHFSKFASAIQVVSMNYMMASRVCEGSSPDLPIAHAPPCVPVVIYVWSAPIGVL